MPPCEALTTTAPRASASATRVMLSAMTIGAAEEGIAGGSQGDGETLRRRARSAQARVASLGCRRPPAKARSTYRRHELLKSGFRLSRDGHFHPRSGLT